MGPLAGGLPSSGSFPLRVARPLWRGPSGGGGGMNCFLPRNRDDNLQGREEQAFSGVSACPPLIVFLERSQEWPDELGFQKEFGSEHIAWVLW